MERKMLSSPLLSKELELTPRSAYKHAMTVNGQRSLTMTELVTDIMSNAMPEPVSVQLPFPAKYAFRQSDWTTVLLVSSKGDISYLHETSASEAVNVLKETISCCALIYDTKMIALCPTKLVSVDLTKKVSSVIMEGESLDKRFLPKIVQGQCKYYMLTRNLELFVFNKKTDEFDIFSVREQDEHQFVSAKDRSARRDLRVYLNHIGYCLLYTSDAADE